jgi:hypothetical protein
VKAGLLAFMGDATRARIAAWARTRAAAIDKDQHLPLRGRPARIAAIADSLCAAYELGYLRRVRVERRRAVPL